MKGLSKILCIMLLSQQMINAINSDSIFHDPEDIFYVNPQIGEIRFKVSKNNIHGASIVIGTQSINMNINYRDDNFDYYVININAFDTTLSYRLLVNDATDSLLLPAEGSFRPAVTLSQTPSWSAGMTYYLINTDGFYNGDRSNDPGDKVEWGTGPAGWSSYGGDLAGIFLKTEYLESLDPDIIMLSPIFTSNSNHKLDPRDYATIDPAYGDTNDLKRLINAIHGMDKRIVLSVVFTHTGKDFPAFVDIAKNEESSQYLDWYSIRSMPTDSVGFKYASWRSDPRFPLLNLRNRQIHDYLIGFIEYWAHFGFDGFFIGDHEEIDADFMGALYDHMKVRYPDLLLLSSDCRLHTKQTSDGCYNKDLTKTLIDYFVADRINTAEFDSIIRNKLFFNPPQINCASLIGLHDYSRRIGSIVNLNLMEMMYAFLFTFCGSPVVMYGDEIGMIDCSPLNWGSFNWSTDQQNRTLLRRIREFIKIRKENPEIRDRHFFTLYVDDIKKVYAYDRGGLIVAMNCGTGHSYVELPAWDGTYIELMGGEKHTAYSQRLRLSIDPMSYRILKREI